VRVFLGRSGDGSSSTKGVPSAYDTHQLKLGALLGRHSPGMKSATAAQAFGECFVFSDNAVEAYI